MTFIGRSVTRLEDRPLVTGRGAFAADIAFPHMLHMRIVRSEHPHGRILSLDPTAALALPGVAAVWTSAEVAAELVAIEAEDLPPVLDASAAPGEFEPGRSTEAASVEKSYGDIAAAFRDAAVVVELDLAVGRHSGVPLETRGAIAHYDGARDVLELYGAAKVPHWNRDGIARMLRRSPASVHLLEGHVGGGFGIRGELYPEDVLVCLAALRLGRPVKWIEDRREHLIAANHSRQQRHKVRAAVDAEGRLLAIDDDFFHDQGGYVRTHAATVPDLAAAMLPGPYRVPAYRAVGRVRLTNKTPCGTYRAPGRFESTFARERMIDAIAARLGLDPIAVRRRNLIDPSEFPYARPFATLGTDVVLDSGDYSRLLDKALSAISWDCLQADLHRRRMTGEAVGAGLAMFVEKSGLGPFDAVHVSVDRTGTVEVITGAASVGQGIETVLAQICADSLGVDYQRVRVVHGQTDRIAFGVGAFASRVTVMTGEATRRAAVEVRRKAMELAAELLQRGVAELHVVDGHVVTGNAD